MSRTPTRLLKTLRSRRLATWLLVGLSAYAALTTAIPQEFIATGEEIASWRGAHPGLASVVQALGLHRAFSSVLFLAPALLLVASTAACAWERTRVASTMLSLRTRIPESITKRLSEHPSARMSLDASRGPEWIAQRLSALGLKTEVSGEVVRGTRHSWAALGSALFHWSLVGLFISAGVGQLVKWEGQIGVPVGHRLTDNSGSYGFLTRGPLAVAAPSTGTTIEVAKMRLHYKSEGVERGHAPLVRLYSGDSVVAESLVFPNSPLRYGSLYIHRADWGLGMVAALETTQGVEVGRRNFFFDFVSSKGGVISLDTSVPVQLGVGSLRLEVPLDKAPQGQSGYKRDLPADSRVIVTPDAPGGVSPVTARRGDLVSFDDGEMGLRVVDLTRYTRLNIVYDPSIPFVYLFLLLAAVGATVALLVQPRAVIVAADDEVTEGRPLNVLVLVRKVDPLFRSRVLEALAAADEGGSR